MENSRGEVASAKVETSPANLLFYVTGARMVKVGNNTEIIFRMFMHTEEFAANYRFSKLTVQLLGGASARAQACSSRASWYKTSLERPGYWSELRGRHLK